MFIVCQNCHRIYDVPDSLLKDSRQTFRCHACGFVWTKRLQEEAKNNHQNVDNQKESFEETRVKESSDGLDKTSLEAVPENTETVFLEEIQEKEEKPDFSQEKQETTENILETPLAETDVFTPVSEEKKTFVFKDYFFAAVVVLLISLIISTFWMGRFYLSRQFPFMKQIYRQIGIDASISGEGLDFKDTVFDVIFEQNLPTMLVRGNIINTGMDAKEVPFIYFVLFDGQGNHIQEQTIVPIKEKIEPGETLPFETKIKPVQPSVRRVDITFKKGINQ